MSDVEDGPSVPTASTPQASRQAWPLVAGAFVVLVVVVCGVLFVRRGADEASPPVNAGAKPRTLGLIRGAPGGAKDTAAMASEAMPIGKTEFRLQGTLPDLGSSAAVHQLTAPPMGVNEVTRLANALGITAAPQQNQNAWVVTDGSATLTLNAAAGQWNVSFGHYSLNAGGGTSGSSGSGGGTVTGASTPAAASQPSSGPAQPPLTAVAPGAPAGPTDPGVAEGGPDVKPVDPGVTPSPQPVEPPAVQAPQNLPSAADAERIARELLEKMGITAEWKVEVTDAGSMGYAVSCPADVDCTEATSTTVVTSRNVAFHRVVDGITTVGLDWSVEIGDNARIENVYGVSATLQKVADYPLRPTADVYHDLVDGTGFSPGVVPLGSPPMMTAGGPAVDVITPAVGEATTDSPGANASDDPVGANPSGTAAPTPPMPTCPVGAKCPSNVPATVPAPTVPTGGETPISTPPVSAPSTEVPLPIPEAAPVVITVTGAERGLAVVAGFEGGQSVQYLVPTYRFIGTYADGGHYQVELVAIDKALVAEPQVPTPMPTPGNGQEPGGVDATAPATLGIEPAPGDPSTPGGSPDVGGSGSGGARTDATTTSVPAAGVKP
jgi:hypothetical protein